MSVIFAVPGEPEIKMFLGGVAGVSFLYLLMLIHPYRKANAPHSDVGVYD